MQPHKIFSRVLDGRKYVQRFGSYFEFRFTGRWMLFSLVIGTVAGIGGIAFVYLQEAVEMFSLKGLAGFYPPTPGGEGGTMAETSVTLYNWWFFIIPTVGGLISGLLVYTFAPEAEGHGTDGVIKAFHQDRGIIRGRVPIVKTLASAVVIGTGGSAGREGPIAQIGAGFGSMLATKLKLSDSDRRIMVVAGMAAGIGSIFRSPIGGALFAVECLYKDDLESEGLVPAIMASIVGYSIFASLFGWHTIFTTPNFVFENPLELIFYGIFGLLCALLGICYVKIFYGIQTKLFEPLKIPRALKPAIGGLMLGTLGFFFPYIMGAGYGWIQMAIDGQLTLKLMLAAAVLKVFATSFSISSGGSGGIFAPSLFMGAMFGGAFGGVAHHLFPTIITQPNAFVLVGMAAFFAGSANVPVSVTIMITEMTGGYRLLVPLIFTSTLAFFVARKWSIYSQQVKNHAESPAHRGDLIVDILKDIPVAAAFKATTSLPAIKNNLPVQRILPLFADRDEDSFPVVNDAGKITGLISMSTLRAVIGDEGIGHVIVAEDIKTPFVTVRKKENLHQALVRFLETRYSSLPVVDDDESDKVLGFLTYRDLIAAYDDELIKWSTDA